MFIFPAVILTQAVHSVSPSLLCWIVGVPAFIFEAKGKKSTQADVLDTHNTHFHYSILAACSVHLADGRREIQLLGAQGLGHKGRRNRQDISFTSDGNYVQYTLSLLQVV